MPYLTNSLEWNYWYYWPLCHFESVRMTIESRLPRLHLGLMIWTRQPKWSSQSDRWVLLMQSIEAVSYCILHPTYFYIITLLLAHAPRTWHTSEQWWWDKIQTSVTQERFHCVRRKTNVGQQYYWRTGYYGYSAYCRLQTAILHRAMCWYGE